MPQKLQTLSLSLSLSLSPRFHPFNLLTQNICSKCSGWHQSTLLFVAQHKIRIYNDPARYSWFGTSILGIIWHLAKAVPGQSKPRCGASPTLRAPETWLQKGTVDRNTNGTNSCRNTVAIETQNCHRITNGNSIVFWHIPTVRKSVQGRAREGQVNAIGTWHWHVAIAVIGACV